MALLLYPYKINWLFHGFEAGGSASPELFEELCRRAAQRRYDTGVGDIHCVVSLNRSDSRFILPSGKHTKNYGTSPFLMGKSTINVNFQ